MSRCPCKAFVLFLVLAALRAGGREVFPLSGDPVLASLLAQALARSPELREAEERAAAARARVPQAGALPDPMVGVGYDNGGRGWRLGADEDTGLGLSFSQAFPWPGKLARARRAEEKEAERADEEARRRRLSVAYEVRKAYADLLLARENLALIEEQRAATRDIEELARSRYAVGLGGQSDVLRPQAELARLEQMRHHEEGLETSALAELNRLLGRPALTPVPPGARLSAVAERPRVPAVEEVTARVAAHSPEIRAAERTAERAEALVDLARRQTRPDLVASASYVERGPLPGMWAAELGLVVPLYAGRKQKQAVAEAEARLRAERAALEATRLRVRAMAEKNLADLKAAVLEAEAYASGVLVVDRLAVESALASYQAGKVPFVAVLEAHGARYRARWEHAELLFHVLWHSAALDAAMAGGEVAR
jgi:outer membrane protein TolC